METFNKENKAGNTLLISRGLANGKSFDVKINRKDGSSNMKYEKMSNPH